MRLCSAFLNDRVSRCTRRRPARALAAALLAFASCGCDTIPALSHRAVLTPAEQTGIGAVAVSELLGTTKLSQDQQQMAVTGAVGHKLAIASGRDDLDWEFKVVSHARPLAVALPDGTVLITDSLLVRCQSEVEVAALLAKEMGCMLAGVYPREVIAPTAGAAYVPLSIEELTPADQSAVKADNLQAADSIGLSMLVRAGYDPAAAAGVWFQRGDASRPDRRLVTVDSRRRNELRQQSFTKSLTEARAVYEHHSAKIGAGSVLAFAPAQPVSQPPVNNTTALEWVSPPQLTAPPVTAAAAPTPVLPGSNTVAVDSDGVFLPPTIASGRPSDGNWSAAPTTAEPRVIEQTSFEQPESPALMGPALP